MGAARSAGPKQWWSSRRYGAAGGWVRDLLLLLRIERLEKRDRKGAESGAARADESAVCDGARSILAKLHLILT